MLLTDHPMIDSNSVRCASYSAIMCYNAVCRIPSLFSRKVVDMPNVIFIPNLDDFISRYLSGESAEELSREIGVSRATLIRRMKTAGTEIRGTRDAQIMWKKCRKTIVLNLPDFTNRYELGETLQSLCLVYNVERRAAERYLIEQGVTPRNVSEAAAVRWRNMDNDGRRALIEPANNAKRGKPAGIISLERRAITMQRTLQLASRADLLFAWWLVMRGISVTPQRAVGRYNIDIAIQEPRVAVEIGGDWHVTNFFKSKQTDPIKRRNYLFDEGWRLIEVRIDSGRRLRETAADRVVSLLEEARQGEPSWGQYCVIWGNGEPAPAIGDDSDNGS